MVCFSLNEGVNYLNVKLGIGIIGVLTLFSAQGATVTSPDGKTLYVCNRFGNDVSVVDMATKKQMYRIPVRREPVAMDITKDGKYLLVANHLPVGRADFDDVGAVITIVETLKSYNVESARPTTHDLRLPTGSGVVNDLKISPDGKWAVVTHLVASFHRAATQVAFGWMNANAITILKIGSARELREWTRIRVQGEGDVEALNGYSVASGDSLPRPSPPGARPFVFGTVLLDTPGKGAANPWGIAWSADSQWVAVTHAGTHEVSVIDFPALIGAMERQVPANHANGRENGDRKKRNVKRSDSPDVGGYGKVLAYLTRYEGMDPGLPYLVGARQRMQLPESDKGPREIAWVGNTIYTTNYFSRTVSQIEWRNSQKNNGQRNHEGREREEKFNETNSYTVESIAVEPKRAMTQEELGEMYFNDATICFQGWQSCASCHPDGRADGLNWDLLNDGIGNPKNTKSLLYAHQTPPAMSTGARETAEMAVRSGIKNILFAKQPESVALAIDAYLRSLRPVRNPQRSVGQGAGGNSTAETGRSADEVGIEHPTSNREEEGAGRKEAQKAQNKESRGKELFYRAGCAGCHPAESLFTDQQAYDVGTGRAFDKPGEKFDTPTLIEVWRTAPYLHDGSAVTIRDVLTTRNRQDKHGRTSNLNAQELDDLCVYVLSL
jgi:YVTN family beta-propeller protein